MSGMGEMGNLLKQAQEMQKQVDAMRGDLRVRTVEGMGAGGTVRVVLTADRLEVRAVHLVEGAPNDPRLLEEALTQALREALKRAGDVEREAMNRITGGMNLPGLL